MELIASFLGALIGGAFALAGGWFAIRWQSDREARGVAGALLAELSVADKMFGDGGAAAYQEILRQWKETGVVHDRQAIVDMFESDPQDSLPVYYSVVPKLGLLNPQVAVNVVEYHARVIGLTRVVVRFLGKQELQPEVVKALAVSVEAQLAVVTEKRTELMGSLATIAGVGVPVVLPKAGPRNGGLKEPTSPGS